MSRQSQAMISAGGGSNQREIEGGILPEHGLKVTNDTIKNTKNWPRSESSSSCLEPIKE